MKSAWKSQLFVYPHCIYLLDGLPYRKALSGIFSWFELYLGWNKMGRLSRDFDDNGIYKLRNTSEVTNVVRLAKSFYEANELFAS